MSDEERPPPLAVIVPTLDEEAAVGGLCGELARQLAADEELVIVDGGSRDATVTRALRACPRARVLQAARGRAPQLNAGAAATRARWLLFLHADTLLPPAALAAARAAQGRPGVGWGYFPVRLGARGWIYRLIEGGMDLRTRLFCTPSGDQGLLVRRKLFVDLGGFPQEPLLEDLLLVDLLRRRAPPARLEATLTTSARRWQRQGALRTVLRMWTVRTAFRAGVSPARLARSYPAAR